MLNRKGQNIAEYSILIALVIAAAVAMQTYVKRGIQGRIADATDSRPATTNADTNFRQTTKQYEPYYIASNAQVNSKRDYTENIMERGKVDRTLNSEETRRLGGATENTTWVSDTAR